MDENPDRAARRRDTVVVGASAGGLQPLQAVLGGLPAALPASVLIVLHMGATSHLAQILARAGPLPVEQATSGRPIEPGRVYVATPGLHMMVHGDHLLLRRGPRENLFRPAIDPLFRSAACSRGGRVIGVVLSGALDDGTSGLHAIKRCGGIAVIQDPADAAVPSMPLSAQRRVAVDHVARADELGALLARLAEEPAGPTLKIPFDIRLETAIAAQELAGMATNDELGAVSRFTCPECSGALWEIDDGAMLRYRCHTGHAFTGDVVLTAQSRRAEELLWSLLRAHQERAALARRLAEEETRGQTPQLAERLLRRAEGYEEDAALVRQILQDRDGLADASAAGMET